VYENIGKGAEPGFFFQKAKQQSVKQKRKHGSALILN